MRIFARLFFVALVIALLVALITACATRPVPTPEPIIVTRDVERIVQVPCTDKRPPAPMLPDDDDDLAAVNLDDPLAVYMLAQIYRAARGLYRQRLEEDDAQIKGCLGE